MLVRTIGHGAASREELAQRLQAAGVQLLVDVRTAPGSRKHPHFGRDQLELWLPEAGIDYRWEPRLGGFRRPPADSPDVIWRNDSFRGYAGHLRTVEARDAIEQLIAEAAEASAVVMCSETLWWRCHRRLIADHLVCIDGCDVRHILPSAEQPHPVTPGARVTDAGLVYDQS